MSKQHQIPTVSIVMPVYNRERCVAAAIESILAQTFTDFELIIVDDGSTDGSATVVGQYLDDERVRYVFQQNSGSPSKARNSGIVLTQGQWVAFLDSDDRWHKDKLRRQWLLVEECQQTSYHLDLVLGDYSVVSNGQQELVSFFERFGVWQLLDIDRATTHQSGYSFERKTLLSALYQRGFAMTQAALVKRSLLLEVGCFNSSYIYAEDTDLWLTIAEKGQVGVVTGQVFEYHHHGENITAQPNERFYLDTIKVLTQHRENGQKLGIKLTKINQRIVNYRLGYAHLLIGQKKYSLAMQHIVSSIPYIFTKDNSRVLYRCFRQLAK